MDQRAELLRAVIENPDEDSPRLAYADWCAAQTEEEGLQAHAEFIRLQLEIRATPLAVLLGGGKYFEQLRVHELVDRWGASWVGLLSPLVDGYRFHRGFVALVQMRARGFLQHASELFALAPIQHLDLTEGAEAAGELFGMDALRRLRSLSMDRCGLTANHIRLLAAAPVLQGLRWLSLQDNELDYEAARILAGSPYLKDLRVMKLRGNPVDPTEELGYDGGEVVDTNLPEAGERLEKEFGRIGWLHWTPEDGRFS
jgi:uncharacterized protein (TIGR02996 family)